MYKRIYSISLMTSILTMTSTSIGAYQWEANLGIGISYAKLDLPEDFEDAADYNDSEIDFFINGAYFFTDIDTDIGPLDQSEFLSKASKVTFAFSEHGGYEALAFRFDPTTYGKTYGMGFKVVVDDYIVLADYIHGALNGAYEFEDVRRNKLALGFGGYLNDTTTLTASYLSNVDSRDYLPDFGSGIVYKEERGVDFAGQKFQAFDNGQSIGYGANLTVLHTRVASVHDITGIRYEFGAHISYHPTKYWTLKTEGMHTDFSKNSYVYKRSSVDIKARYYFVEAFAMDLNIGHIAGKDEFGDVDGIELGLGFKSRF